MKTLYIDINNNPIDNTDEVVCWSDEGSLFYSFLYELGNQLVGKTGKSVKKAKLFTDFNTEQNTEDYQKLVSQWSVLKAMLFGEELKDKFVVTIPKEYLVWLSVSPNNDYREIAQNYNKIQDLFLSIDVEEFYEDNIDDDFKRNIIRAIKSDETIEQIVFNDDAVTKHSRIVKDIRSIIELSFVPYELFCETNDCDSCTSQESVCSVVLKSRDYYNLISNVQGVLIDDIDVIAGRLFEKDSVVYFLDRNNQLKPYYYNGLKAVSIWKRAIDKRFWGSSEIIQSLPLALKLEDGTSVIVNSEYKVVSETIKCDEIHGDDVKRNLFQIKVNGKTGIYDLNNNNFVLPAEYDTVNYFHCLDENTDGYLVSKSNKYGIVTNNAEQYLEVEYEEITEAHWLNGSLYIVVKKNDNFGVICKKNGSINCVINYSFRYITNVFDMDSEERGYLYYQCTDWYGRTRVISNIGEIIVPEGHYDGEAFIYENQITIKYDSSYSNEYEYCRSLPFVEDRRYVGKNTSGKVEIVKLSNNYTIQIDNKIVYKAESGNYIGSVGNYFIDEPNLLIGDTSIRKFCIIDLKGRLRSTFEGQRCGYLGDNVFWVTINGQTILYDVDGHTLFAVESTALSGIKDGRFLCLEQDNNHNTSYIVEYDLLGNKTVVIETSIIQYFGEWVDSDNIVIIDNGKKGIYNIKKKEIILPTDYSEIRKEKLDDYSYLKVQLDYNTVYIYNLNLNKVFDEAYLAYTKFFISK